MERGLGTTHIALTLANYLCSKVGMKTAYIEFNTTNQISALCKTQGTQVFSYKGIDFFPRVSVTSLLEILNYDYQYFVIDMGVLNTYTIQEFLRCDKQFLVCSPGKWRQSQTKEKIETLFKNERLQNHVTVILNLSKSKSTFSVFSNMGRCVSFPFIENPFQIIPDNFHALYQILNEERRTR